MVYRVFPARSRLPRGRIDATLRVMRWIAIAAAAVLAIASPSHAAIPLYDAVTLNIGLNCQWQQRCISRQRRAMNDAHKFIARKSPPLWRIHLCNRNAARSPERIDWIGFNNCIRNSTLSPPPPRAKRHSSRRH